MPFEIVRNDIVNMQVDAIVNTANPKPIIGSGVDSGIHKKAGQELLAARQKIGYIDFGDAVITPGFELYAKYVIHTVGPIWQGGNHQEEEILSSCYRKSLELAKGNNCESIAFPLIATGNYGFPKPLALQIAVREISAFLLENEMQIYLVVFGKEVFALSEKLFKSVSSYIDENYIRDKTFDEYGIESADISRFESGREKTALNRSQRIHEDMSPFKKLEESLFIGETASMNSDDWGLLLKDLDAGFSETLLRLIDLTGKKDSEIYKKANVDRKLFSKIRNNINYRPSKTTALAFAFALELDIDETKDFIARAGFALSRSSKFDVIVEYFLVHGNYNVYELNEVLFAFDQPLIGA
ncbi:MAG: macro domain-containing protein [Peptostreptococcaceae bacterium]|nr:macro domain-containing protein [Peptostreptococcaceae bacterium]